MISRILGAFGLSASRTWVICANMVLGMVLSAALRAEPRFTLALQNRAAVLAKLGRTAVAIADYRQALEFDGDYYPARTHLLRLGVAP